MNPIFMALLFYVRGCLQKPLTGSSQERRVWPAARRMARSGVSHCATSFAMHENGEKSNVFRGAMLWLDYRAK
jgi:hypothetical protein